MSRPAATGRDSDFSLSVDDAAELYARAGHPRTPRTIQRYCSSGHLQCVKAATLLGDKFFIDAAPVSRHIAQIVELTGYNVVAPHRDMSRPAATDAAHQLGQNDMRPAATDHDTYLPDESVDPFITSPHGAQVADDTQRQPASSGPPVSRPVATPSDTASHDIARLEREVDRLVDDREFLRGQIKTKDEQIGALLERDHETNILVRGLQQMLSPLLGAPRSDHHHRPSSNSDPDRSQFS